MSIYWENVHEETRDGFNITLSITPETEAPDWDFQSEKDEQETLRKIDAGLLLWFTARVTASKNGIDLGSEYLGGCCYESIQDFIDGGYYEDMIDQTISEAKTAIESLTN